MDPVPASLMPRNYLRAALLLLVRENRCHGYDLIVRLRELGAARVDPGGLYRTLRTMEQEGLLTSAWEASSAGPPRRAYELTEEGQEWLHLWASTLKETARAINSYLVRYEALAEALPGGSKVSPA